MTGYYIKKLRKKDAANELWSVKTGRSSEEEGLHVDVNFDEPTDLVINWFSVFKIEFSFLINRIKLFDLLVKILTCA